MTENFMKLSDFLKLIKKEDESEPQAAADKTAQAEPSPAPDVPGTAPVRTEDGGGDEKPEKQPEEKKISRYELSRILEMYGWEPHTDSARAGAGKPAHTPHGRRSGGLKNLLGTMDTAVIKELFTPEELEELEQDEQTRVFTSEDIKNISDYSHDTAAAQADGDMTQTVPRVGGYDKAPAPKKPPVYAPEPEQEDEWDGRTVRRSRRHTTGCLGGLLYFGFVLCVSVVLASVGWLIANDVLALNKPLVSAEITVEEPPEGELPDIDAVAAQLRDSGIIEYKQLFRLFSRISHAKQKIDPGTYQLNSGLDYRALVAGMQQYEGWSSAERETVTVMIPEGKTLRESFRILDQAGVCSYDRLLEAATDGEFDYPFLESDTVRGERYLEGYLFPDTYEFYKQSEPEEVIRKMLDNFGRKVTDELFRRADALGYSMHDIVTIASLIEMEAGSDEERPTIASVIYNRLDSNYYPYLQIDASVLYALGEHREDITYADRMIDSPYNTFMHEGLPPGAIANPGIASIRAALMPEETGYYFYALGTNGHHEFFSSYSEFEDFINSSDFGG